MISIITSIERFFENFMNQLVEYKIYGDCKVKIVTFWDKSYIVKIIVSHI